MIEGWKRWRQGEPRGAFVTEQDSKPERPQNLGPIFYYTNPQIFCRFAFDNFLKIPYFKAVNHPKIERALNNYGLDKFSKSCESILTENPKARVVLGLLGGPSVGRYGFRHTAGRYYSRFAARYERYNGYVGIRRHSGPYLYVAL